MLQHLAGFVGGCFLLLSTAAMAGDPAALVMDYQGKPRSDVSLFSELSDGAQIALAQNETLTLMHYRMCKTYAITGGRVAISRRKVSVSGSKVQSVPSEGCPYEVAVVTAGVGGGALVRDVDYVTVPAELNCILVGGKRASVKKVVVRQNKKKLLTIAAAGGRVVAPSGFKLAAGDVAYTLDFYGKKGLLRSMEISPFESKRSKTCLLRVE